MLDEDGMQMILNIIHDHYGDSTQPESDRYAAIAAFAKDLVLFEQWPPVSEVPPAPAPSAPEGVTPTPVTAGSLDDDGIRF